MGVSGGRRAETQELCCRDMPATFAKPNQHSIELCAIMAQRFLFRYSPTPFVLPTACYASASGVDRLVRKTRGLSGKSRDALSRVWREARYTVQQKKTV